LRNSPKQVFAGGWKKIASANHTTNISPNLGAVKSFFIHPAGTMIFLTVGTNVEVREYSIDHDIATIGSIIFTFPITVDANPYGVSFSNDGLFMIIVGVATDTLYRFTMTVPFDLTTVTAPPPIEMSINAIGVQTDCEFSTDGDFVFVAGTNELVEYPLPINYDIASNITKTEYLFSGILGFTFKPEGNMIYVTQNATTKIDEYFISTDWDLSTRSFVDDFVFPVGADPGTISIRSNGDEIVNLDLTSFILTKYHLDNSWNITTTSHFANDTPIPTTVPMAISWKLDDGMKYFIADFDDDTITEFNVPHLFNQTGAIQGASFSLSGTQNRVTGMWWDYDGMTCYIVGRSQDRVNRLDVSSPWDVSTMTDPDVEFVIPNINQATGIFFNRIQRRFYVSATNTDLILQFDMPPPILVLGILKADIENAVFAGQIDVSLTAEQPADLELSPDGMTLLVASSDMFRISRFDLSISGDIESAIFVDFLDISPIETNVLGLTLRPHDGKKLYITGSDTLQVISYDVV